MGRAFGNLSGSGEDHYQAYKTALQNLRNGFVEWQTYPKNDRNKQSIAVSLAVEAGKALAHHGMATIPDESMMTEEFRRSIDVQLVYRIIRRLQAGE